MADEGQMGQVNVRLNKRGKPSIIRWQGLMGGLSRATRITTFVIILAGIASLAFTQLGFVGIGEPGSFIGYGVVLLAPVALGALLLGLWSGTLIGSLAGAMLYLHAQVQPLDYYEVNFVTAISAVVLFTISAFIIGFLLAVALRKNPPTWRRVIYLALVAFVSSILFTISFAFNVVFQVAVSLVEIMVEAGEEVTQDTVRLYALTAAGQMGSFSLQIHFDAALMLLTCLVGDFAVRKTIAKDMFSLRTKFRAALLLVVAVVFVVTAGFSFVVITEQAKDAASQSMEDEITYLISQLQSRNEKLQSLEGLLKADGTSTDGGEGDVAAADGASAGSAVPDVASSSGTTTAAGAAAADSASPDTPNQAEKIELGDLASIDSLLDGYNKEADGTIVVFKGDKVAVSDDPEYEVGKSADEFIGNSELIAVLEGERTDLTKTRQLTYDERLLLAEDLEDANLFRDDVTTQIVYMRFGQYRDYTIMMIMPATKVFATRNATMAWISLSALVLLMAVFALVSWLLASIVVRRIDETNGVLGEITEGNLDARVDIRDSSEFASLSEGINATVDALKDSIAEAESRMDAELATAKAIQESALPRVFPPFPDIDKFDIYATMNAAREVGGDFYDFFLIGESDARAGRLGFVMADVSGKGVPAALFMMKAKTQVRDYMESGMELGEAVENANRQLCDGNDAGMFVTMWVGVFDYETGHVDYVNAGHNPPLLWRQEDGWQWLRETSGLPLGLFDGFPYEAHSVECAVGDQFLLYTDGVTEAMDVQGELYGEGRLEAVANADYASHPRALVEAVRRDVARHARGAEQSDDITILALEVGVPPEVTATLTVPADVGALPRVNEFIHTELDRRLCPLRVQNQLDIAVEELFVNVARYAYPDAAPQSPGMVRVSYTYSAEPPSIAVSIADDGIAYDPLAKPDAVTPDDIMEVPIGGLGILMAKNSVDDMRYERSDGSNIVTIVKRW